MLTSVQCVLIFRWRTKKYLSTKRLTNSLFNSRDFMWTLSKVQFSCIIGYFNKINSVVDYPILLELAVQGVVERYTLYGVVIHFGSLDGGHYIAYGKRGDSWYEFDDEKVSLKSIADVEGDGSAYLLMY